MDDSIKDLNKSFCNEDQSQNIKYYEVGMINMKKTSNFNTMNNSSDPQFSGLLPISTNKKLIDFTKSSNELTIFNSSSNQREVPFFFRRLTRTKEEVSVKDNNIYFERVYKYIKYKQTNTNESYINSEICSPIRFEDNSYLNNIQPKHNFFHSIPNQFGFNEESFESDSVISNINMERLFSLNPQEQIYRKTESAILEKNKRKFHSLNQTTFNVLVTGESGIGKTTFIKCFQKIAQKLDETKICGARDSQNDLKQDGQDYYLDDQIVCKSTRSFQSYYIKYLAQKNYKLIFIDSPGYGSYLDKNKWTTEIIGYLENQFNMYTANKQQNKLVEDCRIHLVLYFLTGPRPKLVDFDHMKEISKYANIIPVISKGDSLTKEEILCCKDRILQNSQSYNLEFFDVFSAITKLSNNRESEKFFFEGVLGSCPPYLIVSSLNKTEKNSLISWGIFDIENTEHSDLMRLYYAISCFIPFESIEKTKKYYKEYKKNQSLIEKSANKDQMKSRFWSYLSPTNIFMFCAISAIGLGICSQLKRNNK